MKRINVEDLRVGLIFTEAVYIEGNSLLVPAGLPVRKTDIEHLKAWGIEFVTTNGEVVVVPTAAKTAGSGPGVASPRDSKPRTAASRILTLPAVQENKTVYRTYLELIELLDAVFSQISAGLSIEPRSIDAIVGRLLSAVRENRDQIIGFILGGEVSGRPLAKSSVNAAILSALIATEMKLPHQKVLYVTTGTLIHDVGMLKLPQDIVEKRGQLSEAEVQRMKAHPLYSFKMICREFLYPEEVGIVALQHHERWDGEGYPRRVPGEDIAVGARIASVADAFEAMVSEKPYRDSMIGYAAMKSLLSDNSRRFDPEVLKAFIKTMGIYPIGSIVLLNNGSIARVEEVHGEAPLRPRIRILIDDFGRTYAQDEGETADLLTEKSLFIARALDPKEFAVRA